MTLLLFLFLLGSDLTFIRTLYKECNAHAGTLSLKEIVKKIKENPSLKAINSHVYQKAPEQKTKKVFFLYNKKLNSSMLKLARKYVESEGMGVRFLVKKSKLSYFSYYCFIVGLIAIICKTVN